MTTENKEREEIEKGERTELPDGFITKEEWIAKGRKEEDWRDPEEFKKRGDEILPIVKAERDKLRDEIKDLKGDIDKIIEFNDKQEERIRQEGYNQALKEIEQKRDAAIEDGDKETVKKLDKDRDKIIVEKSTPVKKEEKSAGESPEFLRFKKENEWYDTDEEMQKWADTRGAAIAQYAVQVEKKSLKEAYDLVAQEAKARFRDKFENPERKKAAAVETEGKAKSKGNGKGWNDLPESAKKQYHRIKEKMALKGREYKKEDYVANYDF